MGLDFVLAFLQPGDEPIHGRIEDLEAVAAGLDGEPYRKVLFMTLESMITMACPPKTGPDVKLYSGSNLGEAEYEEERVHGRADHQYAQGG
jgi:hypothetical protein